MEKIDEIPEESEELLGQEFEEPMDDEVLNPMDLEYDIPIRTDTQLANKVISSHAKNKITYLQPVFKTTLVALPVVNQFNKIVMRNARIDGKVVSVPVIRKIVRMNTIDKFEKKEEDFLIPDWFNDSIPSSILQEEEAALIRLLDDAGISLSRKIINNPNKINAMGSLHRLYAMKMSIAESAKGIKGGAIDRANTTTRKSESLSRTDSKELEEFKARQAKSGIFGLGIKIPLVGVQL